MEFNDTVSKLFERFLRDDQSTGHRLYHIFTKSYHITIVGRERRCRHNHHDLQPISADCFVPWLFLWAQRPSSATIWAQTSPNNCVIYCTFAFCHHQRQFAFDFLFAQLADSALLKLFAATDSAVYQIAAVGFPIFPQRFLCCGVNIFISAAFTALSDGKHSAIVSFSAHLRFFNDMPADAAFAIGYAWRLAGRAFGRSCHNGLCSLALEHIRRKKISCCLRILHDLPRQKLLSESSS